MSQIQKDIEQLVKANVISTETAAAIESYYQQQEKGKASSSSLTNILILLGVVLISLGIILLIAHNWDELSNSLKTIMAFIPLAIGQGLCGYTLIKQNSKSIWREASASFLLFAVASCIALISQIYHVDGTLSGFLITWICLTIPVAFLMRSSIAALLLIAISTWYAVNDGLAFWGDTKTPYWYLVFISLLFIFYFINVYKNKKSNNFNWFNWLFVLSVAICLGCFVGRDYSLQHWVPTTYFALFIAYFLLGKIDVMQEKRKFANPFLVIGTIGILGMLYFASFKFWWNGNSHQGSAKLIFYSPFTYLIILIFSIISFSLITSAKKYITHPFVISLLLFVLLSIFDSSMSQTAALLINLSILAIGIFYINKGNNENHFGILNFGLAIIAILTVIRFFDDGIPFVWRGIFFVATGVGFFIANYKLSQKRKNIQLDSNNNINETL